MRHLLGPGGLIEILEYRPLAWHDKTPMDVNGVQVNAKRSLERAGTLVGTNQSGACQTSTGPCRQDDGMNDLPRLDCPHNLFAGSHNIILRKPQHILKECR